jgi:hypothetical protein
MRLRVPRSCPERTQRRTLAVVCAAVWLLAACGERPTVELAPGEEQGETVVAPECHEVDQLQADLPEGTEPTGTTAEPIRDASMPEDERDGAGAPPPSLAAEIEAWAQREAADSFAGVWIDHDLGGYAVAFATDVDRYAAEVRERFHPGLAVAEANHAYAELRDIQERIWQEETGRFDEPGAIRSIGASVMINRTGVGIFDPDDERLAELSDTYGATAICFEIEEPPRPPGEAVETLAKASGWRDALVDELATPFAVLEVAYDRETAEAAWRDNVPGDLGARDDELPAGPGVYGDLDQVDFDRQAVVVWSSGESGCPEWLTDIDTVDGVIHIERDATADECPAIYLAYRLVLAVDRDRLPTPDELPSVRLEGVPDGEVRVYPRGEE